MNTPKKILVIGASIAGPAICYWLKKYGYSPTLIERADSLRKGGYAIDLRGIATTVAKKMGIYERVCELRTSIEFVRYVDANGNLLFEEHGEKGGFRQGEEVELVRGDLVEILMQTIQDIPCYFNQAVQQINQQPDSVEVIFKDGRKEYYDLVIGTDGLHSTTRQLAFTKDEYKLHHLGSYICIFNVPNYLKLKRCEMLFEKDQKLTSVASDKDPSAAQAAFMFRSNHLLKDIRDSKEQKQFLRDTFSNLGWQANHLLELMEHSENFYFDSVTQVKMPSWTKGRVALLGDAGYCPSPLSGQGSSLAIVGAYILAGELKNAGENYTHAFDRYNELMHPFVEANQGFGEWVSKTFLMPEDLSKEAAAARADVILEKMKTVTNALTLPEY